MLPITAYADRLSVRPGESIAFKVSSEDALPYRASVVRVVCADPNPAGPGIREVPVPSSIEGEHPGRFQPVPLGSYALVPDAPALRALASFTVAATVWPTLPGERAQGIVSRTDPVSGAGFALYVDEQGAVAARVADAGGRESVASTARPVRARAWYRVWMAWDAKRRRLSVGQQSLEPAYGVDDAGVAAARADFVPDLDFTAPLVFACLGGAPVAGHFNGKIERPLVYARALAPDAIERAITGHGRRPPGHVAEWDFSQHIETVDVVDIGAHGLHGRLVNLPARAMKGSNWSGEEHCWRHAPGEYGAIHFHDDDIHDCGWETDFAWDVPADLPSGVYAVKLERTDGACDMVPVFVPAPKGRPGAKTCVLVSTFTYIVYANYARANTDDEYRARVAAWGARPWTADDHPDYGLSTYNVHRDGSGTCHASRLRPMITTRSAMLSYVDPRGSGLRHFAADSHLLAWLDAKGHDFDVITDEDLDAEGAPAIAPYRVVLTGTHPEYHTKNTLDALEAYTNDGGRLMYLGGNGFYWRVARHATETGVIEIRRAEGGIRAWAAEPGEYWHAFDGAYGGTWRRNDRAPQRLVGVGFTAQGIFEGNGYRRAAGAGDSRCAWIFEGVDADLIGDYGFSGGGAAGFELDRVDDRLGTPPGTVVLASSEGEHRPAAWVLVPEEILTHQLTWPREPAETLIRADMVWLERPNGGAVFSTGSITFCGALPWNGFDNDVSRIADNVLRRFRD